MAKAIIHPRLWKELEPNDELTEAEREAAGEITEAESEAAKEQLKALGRAFEEFKTQQQNNPHLKPETYMSPTLGRDANIKRPRKAKKILRHQHFNVEAIWRPWDRIAARTSDDVLIYTWGEKDPQHYIILAVLSPDGHDQMEDMKLMGRLADAAKACRGLF